MRWIKPKYCVNKELNCEECALYSDGICLLMKNNTETLDKVEAKNE